MLSLVEITAFKLKSKLFFKINFPPIRALKIITGHVIYNPSYNYKFQLKTTQVEMTSRQRREANLGIVLISISVIFIICQSVKVSSIIDVNTWNGEGVFKQGNES